MNYDGVGNYNYLAHSIIFSVFFVVAAILFVKLSDKLKSKKFVPYIFMVVISISYAFDIIFTIAYKNIINNVPNIFPISNISPFLFTVVFICLFLPQKWRDKVNKLLCIFQWPMLIAALYVGIASFLNYKELYPFLIFDMFAHISVSLYCFYLKATDQVEISKKDFLYILLFLGILVSIIIVVNLIFNTSFFGLNFYGKHHIYGHMIIKNKFLSALAYNAGLALIAFLGYIIFAKTNYHRSNKQVENN